MAQSRAVEAINRTSAADGGGYIQTNLNPEQGMMGATFGAIVKNVHSMLFGLGEFVGLDDNVSNGIAQSMSDPNNAIDVRGRKYYIIPPHGHIKVTNSDGNSSLGCCSFYTVT